MRASGSARAIGWTLRLGVAGVAMGLIAGLTKSPAAAIAGHVIMHAAAVLHGMETTVQLPPHY